MKKALRSAVPDEQLTLFDAFLSAQPDQSRTLDIWEPLPKFLFTHSREANENIAEFANVRLDEKTVVKVSIKAAILTSDTKPGESEGPRRLKGRMIFPGEREEIVFRAIVKMVIQRQIESALTTNKKQETVVRLSFTLYQLRKELQTLGHDFKLSELREAIEVLRSATLQLDVIQGDWEFSSHPYSYLIASEKRKRGDETGKEQIYTVDFHPLAVQSILSGGWQTINYNRLMALEEPLSRWIISRMNNRFRQARGLKERMLLGENGYTLTLNMVKNESGIQFDGDVSRLIKRIENAIKKLCSGSDPFLGRFEKEIIYGDAGLRGGRPKTLDVHWILFPSPRFASEIVSDNQNRKALSH
jgi:hypothetical protein